MLICAIRGPLHPWRHRGGGLVPKILIKIFPFILFFAGYPKPYVICNANSVVTSAIGVSVAVGGYMYYEAWPNITSSERQDGINSRNLFISTMKNNGSLVSTIFPNALLNDTCDSSWVPGTTNTASDIKTVAGIPQGSCRIATLGLTTDPGAASAPDSLDFPLNSVTTVDTFGIDSGKSCAAGPGYTTPAVPNSRTVASTIGTGSTATDGTLSCATTGVCTLVTSNVLASNGLTDIVVGQTFTLSATSFTLTGCASLIEASNLQTRLTSGPANPLGIFTVATVSAGTTGVLGTTITFQGFASGTGAICTTTPATASGTGLKVTGAWGPLCDNDNSFYVLNTVGGAGQLGGCPRCTTTANSATRFIYTGANQGKFCSGLPTKGVIGTPNSPMAAGFAGTSCILVGVADFGSGSADTGKAMLSPAIVNSVITQPLPLPLPAGNPAYTTYSITIGNIFPTANNVANPGKFFTNSILDFNPSLVAGAGGTAAYKNIGLDTQWGVPCSTPAITQPTSTSIAPMAIVGNVVLRAVNTPQIGAGSCNTMSLFYNGGTGTVSPGNGVAPDGFRQVILLYLLIKLTNPT